MSGVKNLGLVKAIHVGNSAPANTAMIWYNIIDYRHYYHNGSTWVPLGTGGGSGSGTPKLTVQVGVNDANSTINGKLNGLTFSPQHKKSIPAKPKYVTFRIAIDRNGNDGQAYFEFIDSGGAMNGMNGVSMLMASDESEMLLMFETTQTNPLGVYTLKAKCQLGSNIISKEFTIEII